MTSTGELHDLSRHILIGIAARNEERTISATLESIGVACRHFRDSGYFYPVRIAVCVNGCTDRTAEFASRTFERLASLTIDTLLLESAPGQINAQRRIAEHGSAMCLFIMVDADVLVSPESITELYRAVADRGSTVAYASLVPFRASKRLAAHLLMFQYVGNSLLTPRRHLHGRMYAMWDWCIPQPRKISPQMFHRYPHLQLEKGPLVDDIYISRAIKAAGQSSEIVEVQTASVSYAAPSTFRDWYVAERRTFWEQRRLNVLYPEQRTIPAEAFKRRISLERIRAAGPALAVAGLLALAIRPLAKVRVGIGYGIARVVAKRPNTDLFGYCQTTKVVISHD